MKKYNDIQNTNEDGFTLVELLVVILITGILTAIAVPVFLNQRKSAVDATAKSDMHSAIMAAQQYYNSNPNAPKVDLTAMQKLMGKDPNSRITFTGTSADYCIEVRNSNGDVLSSNYIWSSAKAGSPVPGSQNTYSCSNFGANTFDTHVVWL